MGAPLDHVGRAKPPEGRVSSVVGDRTSGEEPNQDDTLGHRRDDQAATAAVLVSMSPDWLSLNAIRWPRFTNDTIDHIAVGPGGVFVISSRSWAGRASLAIGVPAPGRPRASYAEEAAHAAQQIASIVPAYVNAHTWGAVCFAGNEPLAGRLGNTFVCSTQTLPAMLAARDVVLSPSQVREVYRHLENALMGGVHKAI